MSQEDDSLPYALGAVAGVVALVIAGVISLAAATSLEDAAPGGAAQPAQPIDYVVFDADSSELPPGQQDLLAKWTNAARANPTLVLVLRSSFDVNGDLGRKADLAVERTRVVGHALVANGVDPKQLAMGMPFEVGGPPEAPEARRVSIAPK